MARGVPVVKARWVLLSVEAGRWLPHEDHLAFATQPRQLAGLKLYVAAAINLERPVLETLIREAGGALVNFRNATHVVNSLTIPEVVPGGVKAITLSEESVVNMIATKPVKPPEAVKAKAKAKAKAAPSPVPAAQPAGHGAPRTAGSAAAESPRGEPQPRPAAAPAVHEAADDSESDESDSQSSGEF